MGMAQGPPPPPPLVPTRPRPPGLVIAAAIVLIVAGVIRVMAGLGGLMFAFAGQYGVNAAIETAMLATGGLEIYAGIAVLVRWPRLRTMALAVTVLAVAYLAIYAIFNDDLPALAILALDAFVLVAFWMKKPPVTAEAPAAQGRVL
jgi:hypothetical protein